MNDVDVLQTCAEDKWLKCKIQQINCPEYIDHLTAGDQAEVIKMLASYCFNQGNKASTFAGKMAAVRLMHRKDRNAAISCNNDPELELIVQGFKRLSAPVERKQPIDKDMLKCIARLVEQRNSRKEVNTIKLFSIVLGFCNLHRKSELWQTGSNDNGHHRFRSSQRV